MLVEYTDTKPFIFRQRVPDRDIHPSMRFANKQLTAKKTDELKNIRLFFIIFLSILTTHVLDLKRLIMIHQSNLLSYLWMQNPKYS